jgi:hypothetical protein
MKLTSESLEDRIKAKTTQAFHKDTTRSTGLATSSSCLALLIATEAKTWGNCATYWFGPANRQIGYELYSIEQTLKLQDTTGIARVRLQTSRDVMEQKFEEYQHQRMDFLTASLDVTKRVNRVFRNTTERGEGETKIFSTTTTPAGVQSKPKEATRKEAHTTTTTTVEAAPILKQTTTAQVKVNDLPDGIKDPTDKVITKTTLVTIELQHTITSRKPIKIKINDQFSTIKICTIREQFRDHHLIDKSGFAVGDIGRYPLLHPSNFPSHSDIHTEYLRKSLPLHNRQTASRLHAQPPHLHRRQRRREA